MLDPRKAATYSLSRLCGGIIAILQLPVSCPCRAIAEPAFVDFCLILRLLIGAVLAPAVETVVDGLPGSITLRCVRPRSAGMQMPQNAINGTAMVLPGPAGLPWW